MSVLDSFTADTSSALAEAVDGLTWAALAVAGRKLILTPNVPRPQRGAARELVYTASVHVVYRVSAADVCNYHLLHGAWARVPAVAARHGLDAGVLTRALDDYVTALLVTGSVHDFDNIPRLLAQIKVAALGKASP